MIKAPPRLTFVIADDDRLTRSVLRMLLHENHYRVLGEAADGVKAVELCQLHHPDIAFIDIDMPLMNGHQAAEQIRESCSNTQIVMVSSLATAPHVQQAMQTGACAFVVKPFNSAKVNNVIQQCMQKIMDVGKTTDNR